MQFLWEQAVYHFGDQALEAFLRKSDADLRRQLGPPGHPPAANFAEGNVYVCPAAMLKELNDALGDAGSSRWPTPGCRRRSNTQQDRASFIAFVNKQTGKDFSQADQHLAGLPVHTEVRHAGAVRAVPAALTAPAGSACRPRTPAPRRPGTSGRRPSSAP